jgi:hypothetical protein
LTNTQPPPTNSEQRQPHTTASEKQRRSQKQHNSPGVFTKRKHQRARATFARSHAAFTKTTQRTECRTTVFAAGVAAQRSRSTNLGNRF